MLRTGLIRTDRKKVASVESDMSSVTLRHVTHIITVLAAGLLRPIHTYSTLTAPMPFPCHAVPLIHILHAAPLPCYDSAVSFVKVRVVAENIRNASPTVKQIVFFVVCCYRSLQS